MSTIVRKILVVDDEYAVRDALVRFLAGEGFTPRTASSTAEAIELLREEMVDLVVCDHHSPVERDVHLITAMRADRALAHVPVVLLIDRHATPDPIAGVIQIAKPVRLAELLAAVRTAIGRGLA
jgi:two-component system phosphate regulon response regulator PhoB